MYTNFFPTCSKGQNSKNNVDCDNCPLLCEPSDNLILLLPNDSNLEGGTVTSQIGDINHETGVPSNYLLMGNQSDERGNINLDNTDNFSSNSEQPYCRNLEENPYLILSKLRKRNPNKLIIGSININFLAAKFEAIKELIKSKLDILVLQETKIDCTYPTAQFLIEGFEQPFRLDRNKNGGGVIIYIKGNLPCKQITFDTLPNDIECIFLELNLRKQKWPIMGAYNPKKENISYFLGHVSKDLDKVMSKYENILILGDFNSTMSEEAMKEFFPQYDLHNLIKEPTCYKNADNPTSIDVILTNKKEYFTNNSAVETGISDHHKMVTTVLKVYVKKNTPVTINYRSYKNFDIAQFRNDLKENLENFDKHNMTYEDFEKIFMRLINSHAPMKKKVT